MFLAKIINMPVYACTCPFFCWLVVGPFVIFHILWIIIPIDFHFFRGVETTNQSDTSMFFRLCRNDFIWRRRRPCEAHATSFSYMLSEAAKKLKEKLAATVQDRQCWRGAFIWFIQGLCLSSHWGYSWIAHSVPSYVATGLWRYFVRLLKTTGGMHPESWKEMSGLCGDKMSESRSILWLLVNYCSNYIFI